MPEEHADRAKADHPKGDLDHDERGALGQAVDPDIGEPLGPDRPAREGQHDPGPELTDGNQDGPLGDRRSSEQGQEPGAPKPQGNGGDQARADRDEEA